MNNPVCLHCGSTFDGTDLLEGNRGLNPIDWVELQCPDCGKSQEYLLAFKTDIFYRRIVKGDKDE